MLSYYTILLCKLQYSVVVKILLIQIWLTKKYTTGVFWQVKILTFCTIFTWECFFFKHFILNKIKLQKIWKIKNILFKTVPGVFILKLTAAAKVLSNSYFLIPKNNYWFDLAVKSKLISVVCHSIIYHLWLAITNSCILLVLTFMELSSTTHGVIYGAFKYSFAILCEIVIDQGLG